MVTPQNMDTMATAAHKEGDSPKRVPNRHPKAAPIVKEGTISPPLKPAPNVIAVNIIFQKKASGALCQAMASSIMFAPEPL